MEFRELLLTPQANLGLGTTPSGFLDSGYVLRLNGGVQTYIAMNNDTHTTQASGGFVIGNDVSHAYVNQRENQPLIFNTNNTERMRIDSSGNLLVGKTSNDGGASDGIMLLPGGSAAFTTTNASPLSVLRKGNDGGLIEFFHEGVNEGSISVSGTQLQVNGNGSLGLQTGGTTRATIDASGNLLVGKTSSNTNLVGAEMRVTGVTTSTVDGGVCHLVNRLNSDGVLIDLKQGNISEGTISVSGTTVSYNGGHLARWSRMLDGSKPENLLKGTVMTNLDEMIDWAYDETPEVLWAAGGGLPEGVSVGDVKVEGVEATYWEEGDELPEDVQVGDVKTEAVAPVLWAETDGLPEGVSIGDVKTEYKPAGVEENEQLNHTAISSVEGDKDVAGVFIAWDDDDDYNDYNLAMVGDVIIRIAEGVEVKRGDLLVSAGDGTAKPLDPEAPLTVGLQAAIVAKVTSAVVSCTYDDGSFCIPCVLK